MHGVRIPAGSLVSMVGVSANHDDRSSRAERFDIFDAISTGKLLRRPPGDGRANGLRRRPAPVRVLGFRTKSMTGSQSVAHLKNVRINAARMPKDIDGVSLAPIGLGAIRELWLDYDLS
jgi:hypothetical protein